MIDRLLLLLSLMSLCAFTGLGCRIDLGFLSLPQSVSVSDGDSLSFSCVLANRTISQWYIDSKPVSSVLSVDNYVLWKGCSRNKLFCGGTLFIKQATRELNESTVSCQVLHETCNGQNATLSPSATIIVKQPDSSFNEESIQSVMLHTPSPAVPFPSKTVHILDLKPSVSTDDSLKTDETRMQVTEALVQRVPLLAAAGGVCFILGTVFGCVCSMTVARGAKRCRHKPKQRRICISPPLEVEHLTYTELTPAANTSGVRERRDNVYMEIGFPQSLVSSTPNGSRVSSACSGATSCSQTVVGSDPVPVSNSEVLPLPARDSPQCCDTCIEVDLDELERVVLQQD